MPTATAALQAANNTTYDLSKYETIVYIALTLPSLPLCILQAKRGGSKSGWFYLILYGVVQLLGAILIWKTGPNKVDIAGNILIQVGLAPLLFAMKGIVTQW